MLSAYPRRREDNTWRDIGGEVVVLNEEGTQVCLLNKTAALIWTLADGTKSTEEIAQDVFDRFDVSFQAAMADVQEFSTQLLSAELVDLLDQPIATAGE